MSLESMTGFGKSESSDEEFRVLVEIKSVNHRFKDFRFRMPSLMNSKEITFKQKISEHFSRGSFDIAISYKKVESSSKFDDIDEKKVNAFLDKMNFLTGRENMQVEVRPIDFLRSEFFVELEDQERPLLELAQIAFDGALNELKKSRLEEGAKLKIVLENHRDNYRNYFATIENGADSFQEMIEKRLREKFVEYKGDISIDEPRILQEIIFYLEKMDIHEEINRVNSHLVKLDKLIESKNEIGRQLDFLIQELNRETNTIGSKSNLVEISDNVVKMKVELEKIREQGLNLQ